MLRNTKRNVVDTRSPHVTAANLSEYHRAVFFIRIGTIDVCNQAPYHQDFDKWTYNDQCNYESGRQHITNLIAALQEDTRDAMRKQIIAAWPETVRGIPKDIERALGFANTTTGSAYPEKMQPADPDVQAEVMRDARGRMTFKIPTVLDD